MANSRLTFAWRKTILRVIVSWFSLSFCCNCLYRKRRLTSRWHRITVVLSWMYRWRVTYPRHADWIFVTSACLTVWKRFSISNTVRGSFIMILVLKWIFIYHYFFFSAFTDNRRMVDMAGALLVGSGFLKYKNNFLFIWNRQRVHQLLPVD